MVAKFTQKELEALEAQIELKSYQGFQAAVGPATGLPRLTTEQEKDLKLGRERCCPLVWNFFEKAAPSVKQRLFSQTVINAILTPNGIDRYELVCNNLTSFMLGNREGAGPKEKQAFNTFKYYKELSVEAMRYFWTHFEKSEYFGFSTSAYEQWFSSLKLGLYSAPERVLSGVGNLNYPDLNPAIRSGAISGSEEYSPRLEALKAYLEVIYELRVKSQLLDLLIRNVPKTGSNPNVSMGQWEKFVNSTRQGLRNKFGSVKGDRLFKKMFGSDNPTAPTSQTDFNAIQNEVLEQMAQAILREQMGGDPLEEPAPKEKDAFKRDYAAEQKEREAREKENQRQREREQAENDWGNVSHEFKNNPNLVKSWTEKGFTKAQAKEWIDIGLKPKESEYAQFLRDIKKLTPEAVLNSSQDFEKEYQEWVKKPPEEKAPKTPSRSPSPSRKAAQDQAEGKETSPPKHTGFNSSDLNDALNGLTGAIAEDKKGNPTFDGSLPPKNIDMAGQLTKEEIKNLPWLCVGFNLREKPAWSAFSPHSIPFGGGGSGDYVTLLLELYEVEINKSGSGKSRNFSDVLHNFFWAKNLGTETNPIKGFTRLVRDELLPNGTKHFSSKFYGFDESGNLLFTGKRADDVRAEKNGWNDWPFYRNKLQSKYLIEIGVPGVQQKSYRFTTFYKRSRQSLRPR
ncbi:MAG: cell envelope integrity protein TolA [Candidatus Moeniiplasma glomeromycotorum]|nr:cell envelope integrity protein TolA [Candidatus Moeniiplasma glomeromycotorum]MCE8167643.1 cell envelope integrity protein TolA [Candidatus Moeniiplasma glomeromycotorum]MCE8169006.1 cell envelope integrity protein TolA [Candidatus Moeniiplasma glomeromycotorum]